jgi:hypothetical protein
VAEEFYSFERALRELQMREEELKRLVSAGEIRAVRDGDLVKLRREDIERMRTRRGGEVVDLGEEIPIVSEEDPGMATAQISEADTLLEEEPAIAEAIELPVEEAAPAVAAAAPRARARAPVAVETASEGMGMRLCLVVTSVLLVLAGFVAHGAANVQATGIAGGIANFVKGMMQP